MNFKEINIDTEQNNKNIQSYIKQGWGRCNRSNRKVINLLKFKCNSNRLRFLKCNSNRLQSNRFFLLLFLLLSITLNNLMEIILIQHMFTFNGYCQTYCRVLHILYLC